MFSVSLSVCASITGIVLIYFLNKETVLAVNVSICSTDQFQCRSDRLCIDAKFVCDGVNECFDKSDEWNCMSVPCTEDEFRCTSTGHCINADFRCDGSSDCIDHSDEEKCPDNYTTTPSVTSDPCDWNQFYCSSDKTCIPIFRWCDKFLDCSDGSDEQFCDQRKIVSKTSSPYPCDMGKFFCGEDLKCISMFMWCDSYEDCSDGSDELYCDQLFPEANTIAPTNTRSAVEPLQQYICGHGHFSCQRDLKCIPDDWRCDHTKDCSDGSDEVCCDQVCGRIKRTSTDTKIIGGKPAGPKDWPWIAAVMKQHSSRPFCSGVLVSDLHVLTAAHCIYRYKPKELKVRLGEYNFANTSDNDPKDFSIKEYFIHDDYDDYTNDNDIALIRLSQPAAFSEFVGPVCLPSPSDIFETRRGFVAGWGAKYAGGPPVDVLHEIVIKAWDQNKCINAYSANKITDNMLCGGWAEGGMDSCQGDSGGPFLMSSAGGKRWFIAGIVSWGDGCARVNRPGVHIRVNKYLDWIDLSMRPKNMSPGPKDASLGRPFDCSEVCASGVTCQSKVYEIFPLIDSEQAVRVWCDMETNGGGWTILVNRMKTIGEQINFRKNWESYKNGFGNPETEYWIGNEIMHQMTTARNYTLRIDAKSNDPDLEETWGEFKSFKVHSEIMNYQLVLEKPSIGNIVYKGKKGLELHNGLQFTTADRDNDKSLHGNCGSLYGSGMWYSRCYNFFFTGKYGVRKAEGIRFESWSKDHPVIAYADSLQLKIRPN